MGLRKPGRKVNRVHFVDMDEGESLQRLSGAEARSGLKLKRLSIFCEQTKAAVAQRDRGDTMNDGIQKAVLSACSICPDELSQEGKTREAKFRQTTYSKTGYDVIKILYLILGYQLFLLKFL